MSNSNLNGRGGSKRKDGKVLDKFRAVCPPHRLRDLDSLVKTLKGDETKISAKIEEWWEEPAEPEWEDVNKKSSKRHNQARSYGGSRRGDNSSRGGSFRGAGGGRGFYGRGMGGGRGAGAERRREYGDREKSKRSSSRDNRERENSADRENSRDRETSNAPVGVPAPVTNVPRPKGAWGQNPPNTATPAQIPAHLEKSEPQKPENTPPPHEIGLPTPQDPTPSGLIAPHHPKPKPSSPPIPSDMPPVRPLTGNVWAEKGSAHLIEAEKPKPVPQRPPPQPIDKRTRTRPQRKAQVPPPVSVSVSAPPVDEEVVSPPEPSPPEEDVLPLSAPAAAVPPNENVIEDVVGGGWQDETVVLTQQQEIVELSPLVGPISIASASATTTSLPEEPVPTVPVPVEEEKLSMLVEDSSISSSSAVNKPPGLLEPQLEPLEAQPEDDLGEGISIGENAPENEKVTGILNFGRWNLEETDDTESLEFGFGSFGHDNDRERGNSMDVGSVGEISNTMNKNLNTTQSEAQTPENNVPSPPTDNIVSQTQITSASNVASSDTLPTATTSTNNNNISSPSSSSVIDNSSLPSNPTTSLASHNDPVNSISNLPVPSNHTTSSSNIESISSSIPQINESTSSTATTSQSHPQQPPVSAPSAPIADIAAASVSPARPPPGLSIGGMPPMPANAVLVHELEGKLESATLNPPQPENSHNNVNVESNNAPAPNSNTNESSLDKKDLKDLSVSQSQQQPPSVVTSYPETPIVPTGMSNYTYGMGMYNYNPSNVGNGFVGIHTPAGPVLASGVLPQQQKIQSQNQNPNPNPNPHSHPPQQNALYAAPSSSAISNDTPPATNSEPNSAGLPPGMPMQYNPALFNYPQYPQMGQPHGGVGYGYPYNQFQGGGFAYQHMGQNGAYPGSYDEHHQNTHSSHHNSTSGYQKSSQGRYRGQNSHHQNHSHNNTHQYQNQYNPPHNYGGQPYNVNYIDLHRGGYPQVDPNMYNSGYQSNQNFEEGELQPHKKKNGNRGSNGGSFGGPQQFQGPGGPQGGGQGFGFQAGERSEGGSGGWSNQSWVSPGWQGS